MIELSQVTKSFLEGGQTRTVLEGADLVVPAGQFLLILGRSGSGKSTLLHLLCGLELPDAGTIQVGSHRLTELDERGRTLFRRHHVGFVHQFFNLVPTLTVRENLQLMLELQTRPGGLAIADLLEAVGLADRAATYPDRLSGGEQQRVAVARALVHKPDLVLADEPTGNLDEQTGSSVLQLLVSLTREQGRTLVMATHNPEVCSLADRVLRVHEGRLVES